MMHPGMELHGGKEMSQAMNEEWKRCEEYPNYECSSLGQVRHIPTGRLKTFRLRNGYLHVTVGKAPEGGGKWEQSELFLSTLIGRTFLGPAPTDKSRIRFKDGNKQNCRADNLYYGTASDIINDMWRGRPRAKSVPRSRLRARQPQPAFTTPEIPFEKRKCPVCPGNQKLGHCWDPEFRPA